MTLKKGRGQHAKYLPYAFTEQGVAMLSGVLKSERAIAVNIVIMRTFVQFRRLLSNNRELARKVGELEKSTSRKLADHDQKFEMIFEALRQLVTEKSTPRKQIGFRK